jgi:hypothetical protein
MHPNPRDQNSAEASDTEQIQMSALPSRSELKAMADPPVDPAINFAAFPG